MKMRKYLIIIGVLTLVLALVMSVSVSAAGGIVEKKKIWPPEPYLPYYNPPLMFNYFKSLISEFQASSDATDNSDGSSDEPSDWESAQDEDQSDSVDSDTDENPCPGLCGLYCEYGCLDECCCECNPPPGDDDDDDFIPPDDDDDDSTDFVDQSKDVDEPNVVTPSDNDEPEVGPSIQSEPVQPPIPPIPPAEQQNEEVVVSNDRTVDAGSQDAEPVQPEDIKEITLPINKIEPSTP